MPQAVEAAAQRIASPFFSVDVAIDDAGRTRIIEIGDGQVSDLVGWSPDEFVGIWRIGVRQLEARLGGS